jgi:broad-specificity NMP kinase
MRHWSARKIRENVLAEILDSCYTVAVDYYGARRIAQLDTSRVSVSKSVTQSKRILKKQATGKARVDWLGILTRDHNLERYLEEGIYAKSK